MDENLKIIEKECEQYNDTLVIDFDKVVVLRGYVNGDEDYYYIFQDIHSKVWQSSCVGGFIPLKGFLPTKEYERLLYYFQINQKKSLEIQNREIK